MTLINNTKPVTSFQKDSTSSSSTMPRVRRVRRVRRRQRQSLLLSTSTTATMSSMVVVLSCCLFVVVVVLLPTATTVHGIESGSSRQRRFIDYLNNGRKRYAKNDDSHNGILLQDLKQEEETLENDDVDHLSGSSSSSTDDVEEHFIEQRLNHFEVLDSNIDPITRKIQIKKTFRQRYFYTNRFVYNGPEKHLHLRFTPPRKTFAFICMGGEGPSLTKHVLVDSVHCTGDMIELAKFLYQKYHANVHLYALEHRYYGQSYPTFYDKDGENESPVLNHNLLYLSSRQALGDFAHFVSTTVIPNAKVVTFGGSYPGMLSAWTRLKYPHLVVGAVSSSSPVQAQVNFPQYNDRVAYDLANIEIGGSDKCLEIFIDGHFQLSQMLQDGGTSDLTTMTRRHVAELFNVCGGGDTLSETKNINMFLGDGVVYVPAQGNDPMCDESNICNIGNLCQRLIEAYDSSGCPVKALATISRQQTKHEEDGNDDQTCFDVNWEKTIDYLSSPHAIVDGTRSWLWQTCTEFGFYQTCELESKCPHGRGHHPIDMDMEICQRAFDISSEIVSQSVQQSLEEYGGWNITSTNILFINGEIDPWRMLSVLNENANTTTSSINIRSSKTSKSKSSMINTLEVKGASHHFWTHPIKENDGIDIQMARQHIYKQVMEWLDITIDEEVDDVLVMQQQ